MSETAPGTNPYRIYWITWGLLLMITVAMLAAEAFHLPRIFLALFLLTFSPSWSRSASSSPR